MNILGEKVVEDFKTINNSGIVFTVDLVLQKQIIMSSTIWKKLHLYNAMKN